MRIDFDSIRLHAHAKSRTNASFIRFDGQLNLCPTARLPLSEAGNFWVTGENYERLADWRIYKY